MHFGRQGGVIFINQQYHSSVWSLIYQVLQQIKHIFLVVIRFDPNFQGFFPDYRTQSLFKACSRIQILDERRTEIKMYDLVRSLILPELFDGQSLKI